MNPELPIPQVPLERQPDNSDQNEQLQNPESAGEASHEREQNMQQADRQPNLPPPPSTSGPLPPPLPIIHVPAAPVVDDSVGPVIAGDDDLIEKEWVDKAKKIIIDTQNDPFRREQAVNKLQADYLRKRYGKELGTSN